MIVTIFITIYKYLVVGVSPHLKSLHFLHLVEIEYATQVPMSSTLPLNIKTSPLQINWLLMMVLVKFHVRPIFWNHELFHIYGFCHLAFNYSMLFFWKFVMYFSKVMSCLPCTRDWNEGTELNVKAICGPSNIISCNSTWQSLIVCTKSMIKMF